MYYVDATPIESKKPVLKLEALWWMTRPVSRTSIVLPVLGWASADNSPTIDSLVVLLAFIGLAKPAYALLNDLVDEENDKITNPHLPLPSNMLSRQEAIVCMLLTFIGAVVALYYAGSISQSFLINVGLLFIVFIAGYLYCIFKHTGFVASILAAIPFPIGVIMGWLVAGGGNVKNLLIVAIYAFITGFCNNVLAALWDMDKDPLVGNNTIPVRIGPKKAFLLVVILNVVSSALIIFLALTIPRGYYCLPLFVAALVLMVKSIQPLLDKFSQPNRGRSQRLNDVWLWSFGSYLRTISILCIFSLSLGLIVGIIVGSLSENMLRSYNHRIVEGTLLKDLQQISAG